MSTTTPSLPLFETLDPEEVELLRSMMREETYAAGATIFHGGDHADALYLIIEGKVSIAQDAIGRPMRLYGVLGPGDFFGEMGLLNETGRLASAQAKTDVRLYRLSKQRLDSLMEKHPVVELKIRTEAIRRHHQNVSQELHNRKRGNDRIRVGQAVSLTLEDGEVLYPLLDNLSTHGCSLRRVPEDWRVGQRMKVRLGRGADRCLFDVDAKVVWKRQDQVGMAFVQAGPDHEADVARALRILLDKKK